MVLFSVFLGILVAIVAIYELSGFIENDYLINEEEALIIDKILNTEGISISYNEGQYNEKPYAKVGNLIIKKQNHIFSGYYIKNVGSVLRWTDNEDKVKALYYKALEHHLNKPDRGW
jgi:hypothetical protein